MVQFQILQPKKKKIISFGIKILHSKLLSNCVKIELHL